MDVRSDRTYSFCRPVPDVWHAIGRVDEYRTWWPWLRGFRAAGLVAGDRWACTVRPPLPYVLCFVVAIEEVDAPSTIIASVSGDIAGHATVVLIPTDDGGCEVRLRSSLAPAGRPLRSIMRLAPWLARFGHDWVLDNGARQFRNRAL